MLAVLEKILFLIKIKENEMKESVNPLLTMNHSKDDFSLSSQQLRLPIGDLHKTTLGSILTWKEEGSQGPTPN